MTTNKAIHYPPVIIDLEHDNTDIVLRRNGQIIGILVAGERNGQTYDTHDGEAVAYPPEWCGRDVEGQQDTQWGTQRRCGISSGSPLRFGNDNDANNLATVLEHAWRVR